MKHIEDMKLVMKLVFTTSHLKCRAHFGWCAIISDQGIIERGLHPYLGFIGVNPALLCSRLRGAVHGRWSGIHHGGRLPILVEASGARK